MGVPASVACAHAPLRLAVPPPSHPPPPPLSLILALCWHALLARRCGACWMAGGLGRGGGGGVGLQVIVEIPKSLSGKQRDLVEQLQAMS